jgi:hypothetical protein
MDPQSDEDARGIRHGAIRFSLIYWGGALLSSTIFYALKAQGALGETVHLAYLAQKVLRYGSGWLLTLLISCTLFQLHRWARHRGPPEKSLPLFVVASFAVSLLAASAWSAIGNAAAHALPQQDAPIKERFIDEMALGAALLFGWSCLFFSLCFSFDLNERGRRLAAAREEALSAQMRALRYQVNPHFLFNTLNSIAGLIEEGSANAAERMVLSLSGFLRTTLSLDPEHDVRLEDELSLQKAYLEIERERFSDRMVFSIEMPGDVRDALVPSLILQPLIENAVKHGVGATPGRVRISLHARRDGNRLHLWVENSTLQADAPTTKAPGLGVGLKNVAERLHTRFGKDGQFSAGLISPGRYRAVLELPLRLA